MTAFAVVDHHGQRCQGSLVSKQTKNNKEVLFSGLDPSSTSFDDDLVIGFYASLLDNLQKSIGEDFDLRILGQIFAEDSLEAKREFLDTVENCFDAPLELLNFESQSEESREIINQGVSNETLGKISSLLPPGSVSPNTRMVLANAFHLSADWDVPFTEKSLSKQLPFHPLTGESNKNMTYMFMTRPYYYCNGQNVRVMGVPYKNEVATMFIVLPTNFQQFRESLTAEQLNDLLDDAKENWSFLAGYVPKFDLDYDLPLTDALKSLGLQDVFDGVSANFTGISEDQSLFLDGVFHKAFIGINENGTEAAAASGFVLNLRSNRVSETDIFLPDSPFLFVIRHEVTKMILFMGSIVSAV